MMETLWTLCAWTGFVWWCCVLIAVTISVCAAVVEALCAKWEEDELRRLIADMSEVSPFSTGIEDGGTPSHIVPTEIDPEWFDASRRTGEELPANWRELDSYRSWLGACAEMRRRKTSVP